MSELVSVPFVIEVTYFFLVDVPLIEIGVCRRKRDFISIEERVEFVVIVEVSFRRKVLIHSLDLDKQIVGLCFSNIHVNTSSIFWQEPSFEIAAVLNNEVIRQVFVFLNTRLHKVLQFDVCFFRAVLVLNLIEEICAFFFRTEMR